MTRVLILTQYYYPEGAVPTSLAEELLRLGLSVEVLTGFPHDPQVRAGGDYRVRLWRREAVRGVPVTRVVLYPAHDLSVVRRALNYASFAASASVLGRLLTQRSDVIYVYHPPPTAGLAALALRWMRGRAPIIYHVQDLMPEAIVASDMHVSKRALGLLTRLSDRVYRRADRVLAISPSFRDHLISRGVDAGRIEVLYNWCDEDTLKPMPRDAALAERLGLDGCFAVAYAGNMGPPQDLDTVLDAAALLRTSSPQARFILVGTGPDELRLRRRVEDEKITNVSFVPQCSREEVAAIMACVQASLVHLRDSTAFSMWIPSKTQAAMAMAKPLLMGVRGDAADLVREAGAGVVFEPSNAESLAQAVRQMADLGDEGLAAMGARGRDYYMRHLSLKVAGQRLSRIIDDLVASGARRGRRS